MLPDDDDSEMAYLFPVIDYAKSFDDRSPPCAEAELPPPQSHPHFFMRFPQDDLERVHHDLGHDIDEDMRVTDDDY